MENSIVDLFRLLDQDKLNVPTKLVSQAYTEFDSLKRQLSQERRDGLKNVSHIIHCCEQGQFRSARAQLQSAQKEYRELLKNIEQKPPGQPRLDYDQHRHESRLEYYADKGQNVQGQHDMYGHPGQRRGGNSDGADPRGRQFPGGNYDGSHLRGRQQTIDYSLDSDAKRREASFQLRRDNPHITDLSDMHRPTKIAEKFTELYDYEWADAFEELYNLGIGEISIIKDLLSIILNAYHTCKEESELQLRMLEDAVACVLSHGTLDKLKQHQQHDGSQAKGMDRSYLAQYRKGGASLAVSRLQQAFSKVGIKESIRDKPAVRQFAAKCVEASWWMAVQDPPIEMVEEANGKFDMNLYKAYTQTGSMIDYLVWPALLLQRKGPVLSRGVAQGK